MFAACQYKRSSFFLEQSPINQLINLTSAIERALQQKTGPQSFWHRNGTAAKERICHQVSISSIFYEQLFHTKVVCAAFL